MQSFHSAHRFAVDTGFGEGFPYKSNIRAAEQTPFLPSPQKEFSEKGYSITNLFSVLIILSMINENSFL